MSDEDTTKQFSPEVDRQPQGRTLDDLFSLVQSLRGEFTEFRDRVEGRLPLSKTLDEVRADVGTIAEMLVTLRNEVAEIAKAVTEITKTITEIAKGNRRIESKVNGISIDFSEIKGILQNHQVRLQALNSE
jgi:methyl-accepting chemotaxis protein